MANVKTAGTDIELLLLKCVKPFWKVERYQKNFRRLPGKPDILFLKSKIAIFADGDFWHGKNFKLWKSRIPQFWQVKITRNMIRDREHNKLLKQTGYIVLRFWGSDIKKYPYRVASKIRSVLND